jgi:hypothetical protein
MTNLKKLRVADYQPASMKIFNATRKMMQTIGLGKIDFDEENLLHKATESLGLYDFGDDSFRENLGLWLKTIEMRKFHPAGKLGAYREIISILENRLNAEALFKRYPEILERKIVAPIVIMGFARSGTTRLHRMLGTDPQFAHLNGWEAIFPVPWKVSMEAKDRGEIDPRMEYAEKICQDWNQTFGGVHSIVAMEAEEESHLLMQSFCPTFGFCVEEDVIFRNVSEIGSYEYMAKLLKLVSWWRGGDPSKPWVLKAPMHMYHLDSLMHVFPDAKLIFIHRDPIKLVSSTASLSWQVMTRDTNQLDSIKIGQIVINEIDKLHRKVVNVRDTQAQKNQQLDVLYADMNEDWRGVMHQIYEFIGTDFTDATEGLMANWLAESKKKWYGGHTHHLENFGLDAQTVDQKLHHYRERFNIPYEVKKPA